MCARELQKISVIAGASASEFIPWGSMLANEAGIAGVPPNLFKRMAAILQAEDIISSFGCRFVWILV